MGKFGDLDEYFDPGLTLTVLGREYTLPLPSAELGLWCRRATQMAGGLDSASTDEEIQAAAELAVDLPPLPGEMTFHERLLGVVYQQMMANQVPDPYIQFCASVAYIWIVGGEDMAERYWRAGGRPEARGPDNRADRRAATRKTSMGEASATPTPASTSGTSTPTRSGRSGRGRGSRGRRS
jgi:hypothetical protein